MKIGIDARLWNETGVGRYIRNLITFLQIVDKKNDYVLFIKSIDEPSVLQIVSSDKYKLVKTDIHWHSFAEQVKLPGVFAKENVDLMHFPYFSLPILYTKPYVITIHDLIIHHFPTGKASTLPLPFYAIKHFGYKTVLQRASKHAAKIIVPLNATKEDLEKTLHISADRIAVTYEGIDRGLLKRNEEKHPHFQDGKKYFLYVGNAYPHKNLERLLRAFSSINQPDVRLALVGKEDFFYKKIEQELLQKNNASILVLHDIDDAMLQKLYNHAHAVIAPSLIEGFGLVPLEAMNAGTLVIASEIAAHKEVCADAAMYFKPSNTDSLLDVMRESLSQSSEERKSYLKKGYQRIHNFSWQKMAEETVKIYESASKAKV